MEWETILVASLSLNALIGLGYRVYRLTKGGPVYDAIGQAVLSSLLVALAAALALGAGWPRWPALVYGLLFGLVVMPIWVLAVLIPMRPRALDFAFLVAYWLLLGAIVVAALAL